MLKSISRRTQRTIAAVLLVGAGGLMFQNCGTYQAGDSGIDLSTTCDIDVTNCANTALDQSILMTVGNPDIELLNADTQFDVGGYCDNGTFDPTTSKIQYKILQADGVTPSNIYNTAAGSDGWINASYLGSAVHCTDGRFTMNVPAVPTHTASAAALFILGIRLTEIDPATPGVVTTNSVGRATQQINIFISAN